MALGRGEDALLNTHVQVRYVVANSSSYAYFDASRPAPGGSFEIPQGPECQAYDKWKFGVSDLPPYAERHPTEKIEQTYVNRDVTYLLGKNTTDPKHVSLDRSCMAEAQGADRLSRGVSYFAYLKKRHPEGLRHRLVIVEGVGPHGDKMLTSPCGLAALFGNGVCHSF